MMFAMLILIVLLITTVGTRSLILKLLGDCSNNNYLYRYRIMKIQTYKNGKYFHKKYILQRYFKHIPIYKTIYDSTQLPWVIDKKLELEEGDKKSLQKREKIKVRIESLDNEDMIGLI